MRFVVALASIVLLSIASGCTTGHAWTVYDEFTDTRAESVAVGTRSRLSRLQVGDAKHAYVFVHESTVGDSLHFSEVTLVFLVDGKRITLRGDPDFVNSIGLINTYRFLYRIEPSDIQAIGRSQVAEARFYGSDGTPFPPEDVTPVAKAGFRKFYRLFIEREWDRMSESERKAAMAGITKATIGEW